MEHLYQFYMWKHHLHLISLNGQVIRIMGMNDFSCIGYPLSYGEELEFFKFKEELESLPYAQESK